LHLVNSLLEYVGASEFLDLPLIITALSHHFHFVIVLTLRLRFQFCSLMSVYDLNYSHK
jgi:hypothetical protein